MGQILSKTKNNDADTVERPPTPRDISFWADYIPDEVSRRPEDRKGWYTDFLEQAAVAPHQDGKSVVVFWPYKDETRADEVDPNDVIANAATIYETLFYEHGGHPRMVKYLHRLDSGVGFCLERLTPGPLDNIRFPPLSLPIQTPSTQNRILLTLYYRWALQSLSALHFMHSKSMYLTTVGNTFTWLRSDMSIAITGLTCVACPTLVPEWDDHGETGNFVYKIERLSQHSYGDLECFSTDSSECPPCNAAYDIFSWALWIWQLMTNHHSTSPPQHSWYSSWSPLLPIDPASWPDFTSNIQFRDYEDERRRQGAWQVLEEERLGHILVKAWNQEYESADQVMHDVKEVIVKMGMKLIGEDEIELEVCGGRWEDVFDQDLQFACLEKETS
ncbi:serine/threonine protein kinase [Nannizzia gypsea CBS 118893]|uniref:Serine/threonine protein kinase n=1 Tax=Arthroderma gypseum (strain ATCC MYA-4604 / CBS 118893) TaxID=535722 RepID=E4V6A9_ARTGP|nr:serine/threonine protein kinase [Nannizzia gypsea CBS 118893]EFR05292.1 serine/threonine protein kinase [Nannizzia gypsea CBS 118893]